jgi:hypothetical protein
MVLSKVDEEGDVHSSRWCRGLGSSWWWAVAGAGAASRLEEECRRPSSGEVVRICHPGVEREHLCVPAAEGVGLHVVEHAHVAEDLLDVFSRPGVKRHRLNTNLDMKEPASLSIDALQVPRLDDEGGSTHMDSTGTQRGVTLLRVVEEDQEVLRPMRRDSDIPVGDEELPMQLVCDVRRALPRSHVVGGKQDCLAAKPLEVSRHGTSGDKRNLTVSWALVRNAGDVSL